jgi:hypothetical protein
MPSPPSGVVSFLFTDVEGSTATRALQAFIVASDHSPGRTSERSGEQEHGPAR